MKNFTSIWRHRIKKYSAMAGAVSIAFLWFGIVGDLSADVPTGRLEDVSSPDANLKYLFGVYSVTGVAFFLYLFFLTKKIRELKAEIQHLKTLKQLSED